MLNSEGYAVSYGKGSDRAGDMNQSPSNVYYCGRSLGQCRCGSCDGSCGPTDGCPCNSCKELKLSGVPHIDEYVKCPLGHRIALSSSTRSWYCDAENCPCDRQSVRPRWRCVEESCDFDYCGVCYSARLATLMASKRLKNFEGAVSTKSFDYIHTGGERHYCGRFVGITNYANDCQLCNGKCGPSAGCQCRACFVLDDPKFLSDAALRSSTRPDRSKLRKLFPTADIAYNNGDSYQGQTVDGRRHGEGIYRLALGDPTKYLEYPGVWGDDQLLQYKSYQNVWWKCLEAPSASLQHLPSDPSRPAFDVNLLLSAEYLWIGKYFLVKLGAKIIILQNYERCGTPWLTELTNEVEVNGVWREQTLAFKIRFSLDFLGIESGEIIHLPTSTSVHRFGSRINDIIEGNAPLFYYPDRIDGKLFKGRVDQCPSNN